MIPVMATSPAGKKPAPRKTPAKKPAPLPAKKAAGKAVPAKRPAAKKPAPTAPAKRKAPAKRVAPVKKVSAKPKAQLGLIPKQQKFVDEYLVDLNATQAAIRAGYSANTAAEQGYENLRKPHIQLAIAEARKAQQERTQITADRVVTEAWNQMTADARELVQVKVGCCRHCYGAGHQRQRTLSEYNVARERHLNEGKPVEDFDEAGGVGFNPLREPFPECPDCHGDGYARVVLGDTRNLSTKALALYAGAKQTKEGIEIKMHSKDAAMEKLFKHLGLYEMDNQQKTDPLTALLTRIANGNNNGFTTVQDDPEAPARGSNSIGPTSTPDDNEDD